MNRLDKELVERGLAPTRAKAQELIKTGNIKVNNVVTTKPSLTISPSDTIDIIDTSTLRYVSRAGLKLEKAINNFNLNFGGKNIMDIGSSTGGFTDCALQHGADKIIAVDVGSDLMHNTLRNNPKVELHEQTNVKNLPSSKFENIDFITIDVSFVSLSKIFEKLALENVSSNIIALIKPQFECGKAIADKFKGVISSPKIHYEIINNVIEMAKSYGFNLINIDFSPITGGDGNIEYISHFSKANAKSFNVDKLINLAFKAHKK